jgi:Beta-galactosidase/beta-glucuronidase
MSEKSKYFYYPFVLIALTILCSKTFAQEDKLISDLRGFWKFTIGDDMKWAQMNYDDKGWDEIRVPSAWENEGYHGYDGYAWYRKKVYISSEFQSRQILFDLGRVDDIDEVYFNGTMIGKTGVFPPEYYSAYTVFRKYKIPNTLIKFNDWNLIAIRVYDDEQIGGIVQGNVSIISSGKWLYPNMSLESLWKIKRGDNIAWKEKSFDDSRWDNILVPAKWEEQCYPNYDGYAWYRKKFVPLNELKDNRLVLMLGKIDDYDEVFLNGVKIGSTGNINNPGRNMDNVSYQKFRGYFVPDGLLKFGVENVIAVRVYDGFKDGGIYEGPVGFVTQQRYIQFWRDVKKQTKGFWEKLFLGE